MSLWQRFRGWVDGEDRSAWYSPEGKREHRPHRRPHRDLTQSEGVFELVRHLNKEQKTRVFNTLYYLSGVVVCAVIGYLLPHLPYQRFSSRRFFDAKL
jgi:hypothetical protein